jgi:hypothetical protein
VVGKKKTPVLLCVNIKAGELEGGELESWRRESWRRESWRAGGLEGGERESYISVGSLADFRGSVFRRNSMMCR